MTAAFDAERAWTLNERVSLRPESFGALAYHFGTRRLTFLKHPTLVRVVEALGSHDSALGAIAASGVSVEAETALLNALGTLAESDMIVQRTA